MKRLLAACLMQMGLFCGAEAQEGSGREPMNEGIQAARKVYWIDYFQGAVARISKEGDFGLIDSNGRVLCPPRYDMIFDFEGPVARVTLHGAYGLINRQGQEVHPVNMNELTPFSEGMASYKEKNSWTSKLINEAGKEISIKDYKAVSAFKEGQARFARDTVYGIIDKQGHEKLLMIRTDFPDEQVSMSSPAPAIQALDDYNLHLLVFQDGRAPITRKVRGKQKFGFVDTSGKVIIPLQYDAVSDFKNGFAGIQLNDRWGIISTSGEVLIKPQYASIRPTINGLFIASSKNKFGIVEKHNLVVVPFKYDYLRHLFKNLFEITDSKAVSKSRLAGTGQHAAGAIGVIDDKGAVIIPAEWDGIEKISGGLGRVCIIQSRRSLPTSAPRSHLEEDCKVFDEHGFIDERTFFGQETIIDIRGQIRPGNAWKYVRSDEDPTPNAEAPFPFALKANGRITYVYLDDKGRQALKDTYSLALPFKDGVAIAAQWPDGAPISQKPLFEDLAFGPAKPQVGKYGLIDTAGRVLIPFEYEEISFRDEQVKDVVPAKKGGKWGVVNFRNEVLLPFEYDYIFTTAAGIVVIKDRLMGLMDLQGAVLLPVKYGKIQPLATGIYSLRLGQQDFYGDKHGEQIK